MDRRGGRSRGGKGGGGGTGGRGGTGGTRGRGRRGGRRGNGAHNKTFEPTPRVVPGEGSHSSNNKDHSKSPDTSLAEHDRTENTQHAQVRGSAAPLYEPYIWNNDAEIPQCLAKVAGRLQDYSKEFLLMPSSVQHWDVENASSSNIWYTSPSQDTFEHEYEEYVALQKLSFTWALFKDALYHVHAAIGSLNATSWQHATNMCQVNDLAPYVYGNTHLGAHFWQRNHDLLRDIAYLSDRRTNHSSMLKREAYRDLFLDHETVSHSAHGHYQVALEPIGPVPHREEPILAMEKYSARSGDYNEDSIQKLRVDQREWAWDFERGVSIEMFYQLCWLVMRRYEVEFLKITEEQVSEAYTPVNPSTGQLSTPGPITFAITLTPSSVPDSLLSMEGSCNSSFLNPSCNQSIGKRPFAVSWWFVSWMPNSRTYYQEVLIDIAHHKDDESEAIERLIGWARACSQHLRATVPSTTILPLPLVLLTASGSLKIFRAQDRAITAWWRFDNAVCLNGWYQKLAVLCCLGQWVEETYRAWLDEYAREYARRADDSSSTATKS